MARRLAAILIYDVVGYSLAIGRDEASTLRALKSNRNSIIDPQAAQHGGRTIKLMGDGGLLEFASAVDALRFAVAMQCALVERNKGLPDGLSLVYRIGINIGDVVVDGDDIYGDGVNIAARLEGLAEPGGISVHQNVRDQARGKLDLDFEDFGEVEVKNIEQPLRVFHITLNDKAAALAASSAEFEPVKPAEMAKPLPAKPSIAVLALNDHSTGDNQGFLSDAISEGIITELSRFSEFFVIARNSSFKYRDKAHDVRDIARELGVHYVLEGSQQKSGERLRITVQLIDALAGNHIWAETYDRDLADLFAVQDEIVRAVASSVGAKIAFRPPPSGDLARVSALQYHLKARQFIGQFSREGTEQARLLNLKAIEADPTSPFGYIGLTFVYGREYQNGWGELDPEEALARAVGSAEKGMELDPENYDVYNARAWVHVWAGEQDQAIARFKQAIALNPSATNVIASLADPLVYVGRVEEAIELLHRAMRLDPNHPDRFYWSLAWAQWHVNECEAALATMRSMAKTPNGARRTLATIYVCLGRQEEAEATIAKFLESAPGYTVTMAQKKNEKLYDDPADVERWLDALRGAGLPE